MPRLAGTIIAAITQPSNSNRNIDLKRPTGIPVGRFSVGSEPVEHGRATEPLA